jgi:hypothetical protein
LLLPSKREGTKKESSIKFAHKLAPHPVRHWALANGKNPEKGRNLFENFGTDSLLILIFGLLEMFSIT